MDKISKLGGNTFNLNEIFKELDKIDLKDMGTVINSIVKWDKFDDLVRAIAFEGAASPKDTRPVLLKYETYTLRNLVALAFLVVYRGQTIGNLVKGDNDLSKFVDQIINDLKIRGKDGNPAKFTVGKIASCFPDVFCAVAFKKGGADFQGISYEENVVKEGYKHVLPNAYQHISGYSLLPFAEMSSDQKKVARKMFCHYSSWYINMRVAQGQSKKLKNPPSEQKILEARIKNDRFLDLQERNPWAKALEFSKKFDVDLEKFDDRTWLKYDHLADKPKAGSIKNGPSYEEYLKKEGIEDSNYAKRVYEEKYTQWIMCDVIVTKKIFFVKKISHLWFRKENNNGLSPTARMNNDLKIHKNPSSTLTVC